MRRVLLSLLLLVLLAPLAWAVDLGPVERAERAAQDLKGTISQLQAETALPQVTTEALTDLRGKAEALKTQANAGLKELDVPLADIGQQIDKLGPPPEGAADPLAGERKQLTDSQARHANAKAKLDLVILEADQLIARTATQLQERFLTDIFKPSSSVLAPSLWAQGAAGVKLLWERCTALVSNWKAEVTRTSGGAMFFAFPLLSLAIFGFGVLLQRWLANIVERRLSLEAPTDLARFARALVRPLLWLLALLIAMALNYGAANALGVLAGRAESLMNIVLPAVLSFAVSLSFLRSILAPQQPAFRLIPHGDLAARETLKYGAIVIGVLVLRAVLREFGALLFLPLGFTVMVGALSSMVLVLILVLALRTFDHDTGGQALAARGPAFGWLRYARVPAMVVVVVAVAALLFGYIALADFVTSQFFETLNLLAVLHVLHRLADAFIATQFSANRMAGRLARRTLYLSDRGLDRLRITLRTLADVALILIGLPALLVQWAVTWIDVSSLYGSLGASVQLGGLSLSAGSLIIAAMVLLAGLFFANLFTRWLDRRVLAETRLDVGLKDSIRKGSYYAGIVLAGGFALTAAGLDFSNIAIVAGALGVGIGFGLQSIVNNFVSGLILLAERPIKVGDWVVVAAGEGIVKRINVRSTEIETFDSCTIIVPNSSLITGTVSNWTHDDMTGRFTVALTLEYGNDAKAICDMLESMARAHTLVLDSPAPACQFTNFAQTGMLFQLHGFVANVFDAALVASDLRIAIDAALKAKGIRVALPYPMPVAKAKK